MLHRNISTYNEKNLRNLVYILGNLVNPERFDSRVFFVDGEGRNIYFERIDKKTYLDYNSACSLCHLPINGPMKNKGEDWYSYCERTLGVKAYHDGNNLLFNYLFSDYWSIYDNSINGAIRRITNYLNGDKLYLPWICELC